jgi:dihydroorotate dehydrogenase electron transfer subunit
MGTFDPWAATLMEHEAMADEEAIHAVEATRPRRLDLPVLARRQTSPQFVCLSLAAPPDWISLPGQFINILCESDPEAVAASEGRLMQDEGEDWPSATGLEISRRWPVVRRPYSISRMTREGNRAWIEILVRAVGCGSRFIQARPVGSTVNVIGPLGNHFTAPKGDPLCILVGGGCGVAPIFGLADYLAARGKRCLCFFGASHAGDMPVKFREPPRPSEDRVETTDIVEEFASAGVRTVLASDDGSAGFRGNVTQALRAYLTQRPTREPLALYGCGPTPMLKAMTDVATEFDAPCQLSLERFMGCGIGVCLSCVTKRKDPASEKGWTFRLTCREGPVVDANNMIWS